MNLKLPALFALAGLALTGCVVSPYYPHRGVVYTETAEDQGVPEVYADGPPPAAYYEPIPVVPYAGAVWVNGYWGWRGGRYAWVGGRYVAGRPGYHWAPHRWEPVSGGRYRMRGGVWIRG